MAIKKTNNDEIIDLHNKVSPIELESIIKKNMLKILEDPENSKIIPPILIRSSPGIGKSSIVKAVADELGIGFIDQRLTQMEPCDIRGLPVPNRDTNTMDWFVNGTWPREEDSAGILFLDELTSAERSIQCASYELILDRRLGELYKIPKKWMIVAAGNMTTDKAIVNTMSSALANRFMHLQLDSNIEDWSEWARHHDIHPSVTGFLNYRPEYLFRMEGENLERGWPSPRSWERVSTILKMYSDEKDDRIIRKLVYGLIGNHAGVEFMEFRKINEQFDNVLDYMVNPNIKLNIPERSDAKYALVSAMTYLLWRGKDAEDENRRVDGFFRICMELTSDFASMAMFAAMSGTDKRLKSHYCDVLFKHPKYKEWVTKHGKALRKRIEI